MARPAVPGEFAFGSHANRQDHEICGQSRTAFRDHDQAAIGSIIDPRQAVAEMERHALRHQVLLQRRGHLGIERRHDLRQLFQHA